MQILPDGVLSGQGLTPAPRGHSSVPGQGHARVVGSIPGDVQEIADRDVSLVAVSPPL